MDYERRYLRSDDQRVTQAAPDGAGGLWAVDSKWDGTYSRLVMHKLQSTGAPVFASAGVEFAAVYQGSVVPAFMRNTSGGCTAYVWYDNWGSVNSSEIYRQEITSAGLLPLGLQGALVARSDNVPTLVESSGSVLLGIVEKALGRVGSRLRVQRLGFDGTPHYAGTGIIVGPPTPIREMTAPSLSMAADGMIVAAWVDGRYRRPTDSLRYQIFGQAVTSTGAALWDDAELPVIHQSPTRPAIRVGSRG